jgi:hypothetical protein
MAGYYRRFGNNYGINSRPLHDCLKKDSFQWSDAQIEAFTTLKNCLVTAPVMALPDLTLPFTF